MENLLGIAKEYAGEYYEKELRDAKTAQEAIDIIRNQADDWTNETARQMAQAVNRAILQGVFGKLPRYTTYYDLFAHKRIVGGVKLSTSATSDGCGGFYDVEFAVNDEPIQWFDALGNGSRISDDSLAQLNKIWADAGWVK